MAAHSSTLSGKLHGQRRLVGYSPWGHQGSDTTERTEVSCGECCLGHGRVSPVRAARLGLKKEPSQTLREAASALGLHGPAAEREVSISCTLAGHRALGQRSLPFSPVGSWPRGSCCGLKRAASLCGRCRVSTESLPGVASAHLPRRHVAPADGILSARAELRGNECRK